jgi:hypothetical protein
VRVIVSTATFIWFILSTAFAPGKASNPGYDWLGNFFSIIATAVVGVVIFWIQKKADRNVNIIIERDFYGREQRKQYWARRAINVLKEIKELNELNDKALGWLHDYNTFQNASLFIEKMKRFFSEVDFSFKVNFIEFMP